VWYSSFSLKERNVSCKVKVFLVGLKTGLAVKKGRGERAA